MKKPTQKAIDKALAYRTSKAVTHYYYLHDHLYGRMVFPICPSCDNGIEREYQKYCDECGQRLKWGSLGKLELRE